MATTYDKASLVMIPSGYKDDKLYSIKPTDGSGDFTFSRDGAGASPATRVNASGYIEKGRENTTIYSQDATNWTEIQAVRDSATASDPFGGTSAGQYSATGTSAGYVFVPSSPSWSSGQVVTGSIYIRDIDSTYVQLTFGTAAFGASQYQNFDLSSGAKGTGTGLIDSTITSVGGGWYRLSITAQAVSSGSSGLVAVFVPSASSSRLATPNAGQTLQIFGFQTENGLVATDYIETTTAPVSAGLLGDMPRLDYSGGATCPSLLLEPSRVNSLANSEYIGGSGWTKLASTTSYNEITTPEGVDNSVKLKPNNGIAFSIPASGIFTAGASSYVRSNGITLTATDYTFSVFVKKGDFDHLQLRSGTDVDLTANATTNLINLNDGTASVANSVEEFGNGWYRVSLTFTATAATWYVGLWFWNTTSVTANGSQGVYAYGAQLESGSYPTSYIPTYGAAAPRAADVAVKTGVSSLIGQTEGTLYFEGVRPEGGNDYSAFGVSDGTTDNEVWFRFTAADTIEFYLRSGGGQSVGHTYTGADLNQNTKIAFAYKANDVAIYVNGNLVLSDNSVVVPASLTQVSFYIVRGANQFNMIASVKQALLFKTRLTNAELASLTTL